MGKKERLKGHDYEREVARKLRGIFPEATRHLEYQDGEANGVDLKNTGPWAFQCKRRKTYAPVNAIFEIKDDTRFPILVTKADYKPDMVVMPLRVFIAILEDVGMAYHYDPPPF